ncbi:hypothetical protein [Paratractidigestivibacter faecalis]|uniref:hypothetical protein n=1 Tax=Paratractidigestivibacter faecalis TaxID=2292441 RepID=UPI003AB30EE7
MAPAVGALLMLVDVTIPVALLAATLPLRKGGLAARSAAALTAFMALLAFLAGRWGNDGINAAAYLLTFSLTLAIMALDVWLVCMATPWSALFCASAGYTAQNLGSSLAMLCNSVMGELGMGPVDRLQENLVMLVVFVLYQRLFVSRVHRERLEAVGDRYMLVGFFFCMLAVIGFDIAIKISVSEGVSAQTHVLLRVVHLALCGFLLLFEYRSLFETKLAVEAAIDRKIIEERSRQYEEGRKSIEALNKRMHDLVHGATRAAEQMGALDNPQVNELLEQIMGEVAHYDAIIRTGNESVDTVLTEKSLVCEREGDVALPHRRRQLPLLPAPERGLPAARGHRRRGVRGGARRGKPLAQGHRPHGGEARGHGLRKRGELRGGPGGRGRLPSLAPGHGRNQRARGHTGHERGRRDAPRHRDAAASLGQKGQAARRRPDASH